MRYDKFILVFILLIIPGFASNSVIADTSNPEHSIQTFDEPVETNATFTPSFELSDEDEDEANDTIGLGVDITNPDFDLIEIKLHISIWEGEEWHLLDDAWSEATDSDLAERFFEYTARWDADYKFELFYYVNEHYHDNYTLEVELDGFSQVHDWWVDLHQIRHDEGGYSMHEGDTECGDAFELDVIIEYDDLDTVLGASLEILFKNDTHEIIVDEFETSKAVTSSGKLVLGFDKYTPEVHRNLILIVRVFQGDEQIGIEDLHWKACPDEPERFVKVEFEGAHTGDVLDSISAFVKAQGHEHVLDVLFKVWDITGDNEVLLKEFSTTIGVDETSTSFTYQIEDTGKYLLTVKVSSGDEILKNAQETWTVGDTMVEPFVRVHDLQYSLVDADEDACSDTVVISGDYKWHSFDGTLFVEFYAAGTINGQEFEAQLLLVQEITIQGSGSGSFNETLPLPVEGSVKFEVVIKDQDGNLIFEGSDNFEGLCAFVDPDGGDGVSLPVPLASPLVFIVSLISIATIVRRQK